MRVELFENPKNVVILEGFPGYGFVATLATSFLLDKLKFKLIGRIWSEELPPVAVIHEKRVLQPLGIYYNKKCNLVMLHALTSVSEHEWELAQALKVLYKKLNAQEIVSIEGISPVKAAEEPQAFFYSTSAQHSRTLQQLGYEQILDGVIVGVSGALLLTSEKGINATFVFAEALPGIPDARAAAKIIEVLNRYLNLNVDYTPLIKQAEMFEEKLRQILERTRKALIEKKKKEIVPYVS